MVNISKFTQIQTSDVVFTEPKTNRTGGMSIGVTLGDNENIVIQTPKCELPGGIHTKTLSNGKDVMSVDVAMSGDFMDFMTSLDTFVCKKAHENSKVWFKKKLTMDEIKAIYKPQILATQDGPVLKAKVTNCSVFDELKHRVPINSVKPHCVSQCILELTGMYFIAKEFGMTWKVLQMRVYPPKKLSDFAFVDSDQDSDTEPL